MPNIKKEIAKHLGKRSDLGVRTVTLIKVTPGTRTPGALIDGTNSTTVEYSCKGFESTKRSGYVTPGQSRTKTLTISILGGSLPDGIEPKAGDKIVSQSVTYTIAPDGVSRDPVGALFDCVVRGAGG